MVRNIAIWAVFVAVWLLAMIVREEKLAAQGKVPMGRLRRLWFGAERRRAPRYRVDWTVKYRRTETPGVEGKTHDVSETGAGLTLNEKVPPGSLLELEVPLPGRPLPLKVTAVVVWSKEMSVPPQANEAQRRFFVGVHFQNLGSTLEQELGALLKVPGYPVLPETPPDRPADNAKLYASWKRRFWLADLGLTIALFGLIIWGGVGLRLGLWVEDRVGGGWPLQVAVFSGLLWAFATAINFPLDWLRGFRLEHRFGLSTQSFAGWMKDYGKQLALGGAMGLAVVEGLSLLLRAAPATWWLWAAAAWLAWGLLLTRIFPTLVIPLFYKQQPLQGGPVRERLEKLLERSGTRVRDMFSINLSRTTRKANACLCGIGKSRRVLLSDTLLSKYPPEEIEVVLAHELGHHRLHHIGILIGAGVIASGLSCLLVDWWARSRLADAGVTSLSELAALPLLGFGLFAAGMAMMPVTNGLSRRLERQADRYALEKTGDAPAFIAAMRRLAEQNLAEETPPLWVEWLLYDHPSISKRIAMAEAFKGKRG